MDTRVVVVIAAALGGAAPVGWAAQFTPIPQFDAEFPGINVEDMTPDGNVVVGSVSTVDGFRGYRWTAEGGMEIIPSPPETTFGAEVFGVTDDGITTVGYYSTAGGELAAMSMDGALMQDLGIAPNSFALEVSGDGSAIVGRAQTATSAGIAFHWTTSGGLQLLGDLDGGVEESLAIDVSADGSVVTGLGESEVGGEAFVWTQGEGLVGLGGLAGGPGESRPIAISGDGTTVVGDSVGPAGTEAYYWTSSTGMVGLGELAGGTIVSTANAVSSAGDVIVGRAFTLDGPTAFYWTEELGMVRLEDIAADFDIDLRGWTLTSGLSISADGRTIAGLGRDTDGFERGFVLEIPSPSGSMVLVFAAACVRRRRV